MPLFNNRNQYVGEEIMYECEYDPEYFPMNESKENLLDILDDFARESLRARIFNFPDWME